MRQLTGSDRGTTAPRSVDAITLGDSALPRTYRLTDEAAKASQRSHVHYVFLYITLGLVGASLSQMLFGTFSAAGAALLATHPVAAAWFDPRICLPPLVLCVVATIVFRRMLNKHYGEREWCRSRNVAEQARSRAWLYMMSVDPQQPGVLDRRSRQVARQAFVEEMKSLRNGWLSVAGRAADVHPEWDEVTAQMDAVRALSARARIPLYLEGRLGDQLGYYAGKAARNAILQCRCQRALAFFEAVAFALVTVLVLQAWGTLPKWFGGLQATTFLWPCLTGASSVLAWSGYRRYAELAVTYELQKSELAALKKQIQALEGRPNAAREFLMLVLHCEELLTRENQIWLVRRGHL